MKEIYVAKFIKGDGTIQIASTFWTDYTKLKEAVDRSNKKLKWTGITSHLKSCPRPYRAWSSAS